MSVNWEKKEGSNSGKLTFEVQPDKIKEGLDIAFNKVKKNINVPGFRKGKVPRNIYNKMYGEESLYQDALNAVLPEVYSNAIEESQIKPVARPEISVISMDKGKAWVLSAQVTVEPEVQLGQYKDLEVTKHDINVTDKEVDEELEHRRQQQAELVLKEDKPAENGDTVIIDFIGKIDGKPFDGGKSENYSLILGSKTFIPGFEDQLIGHSSGDNVQVKVTFPDNYQSKKLQGKDAVFDVKIHEIKQKKLPKLDDEFAKDLDDGVNTLAELRSKIKDEIKQKKEEDAKSSLQEEVIAKAVQNSKIEKIPEIMIEDDIQHQIDQYFSGMQQQGIKPETYFKLTGTSEEDLREQFKKGASERVKTNLVLDAIVLKENLEVSKNDLDEEIKNLAKQYNMKEEAVRSALSDDMLKHDISIRKVIDEMTKSAKQVLKSNKDENKN